MVEKKQVVKILNIIDRTPDVKTFVVEKPLGYKYLEGQATEVSINKLGFEEKGRPFTFTGINTDKYLEFTIKIYDNHEDGVTKHLRELKIGDSLIIGDVFGAIKYTSAGVFIAGGSGITPFIAILRKLRIEKKLEGNTLIFSNKTISDIILKDEFKEMESEGLKVILKITRENIIGLNKDNYLTGRINKVFLENTIKNWNQNFYICGPIQMVNELQEIIKQFGTTIESIIFEN
ncbi:MAG: flavodoxin reductase [Candidatus ainarchaeum sp.]|nr:flavodoxin reductase [Candidatus ainarchaeum sp.]